MKKNVITFSILQRFRNSPGVKERFTKYDIGKKKASAQFFSIGVGKLLRPADLLLEKDLMILIISSGGFDGKNDFFPDGIILAMLGPIFLKKMLKISAIFTGLKSKTPLFF